MKDIHQKLKAVRYCVALGIIPNMEVVVRHSSEVSETSSDITDVDVLGIRPCDDSASNRIIFDCKTLSKMSPINRALWAKGLMSLTASNEAFVILIKAASEGHRLAGNTLGVRLFTETLFEGFSRSVSKDFDVINSYIEQLDAWHSLATIPTKNPQLDKFWDYLNSSALLETQGTQGLRTLMSHCKKIEGELDPQKATHRALFKLILVQMCLYMSEMVRDFHNIFNPAMDKPEFEKIIRYYIWGGKDNYDLRQRLNIALKNARGIDGVEPFEFPAWEKFVTLFRSFLDAPLLLGSVCLPLKDLAFREVCNPVADLDRRLALRLNANERVRQFIMASSSYLIAATRIPKEFKDVVTTDMSIK
ncbi:MAG: hypothetical protein JWQ10_4158 [Herbaspirillum sp.]|nr:hypothetical protein [Herbaspirillum sp.]